MSEKVLSLPLDDPFSIPDDVIVDLSQTKFSDDFIQNISTAFIYLRNIEYSGKIDFSKFSEDQLFQIVKSYMLRDIKDFNIEALDYTVLSLMFPSGSIDAVSQKSLLSDVQSKKFIEQNYSICKELFQLIFSLPLYIMSLDRSEVFTYDYSTVQHITEMPMTYECMLQLLKYDETNLVMFLLGDQKRYDVKSVMFDKVFKYENSTLADKVQGTTYFIMYRDMIAGQANGLSSAVLSAE